MSHLSKLSFATLALVVLGLCIPLNAASVKFLPLNEAVAARKLGFKDAKGVTKLKGLTPMKRSNPYKYDIGKKSLQLQLVDLDVQNPEFKPITVAITISPDIKSPLVLIMPDPKDAAALIGIAIEDSSSAFPWGSIRFLNTTDKPLMVRYEKEVRALPESFTPVNIVPGGAARNMGVQLFKEEEPKAILYSAVWEHDPNVRKLVIITLGADVKMKAYDLKIIPEDRRATN